MAMMHRKLFLYSTSTNQTDCPDFCDSSCPYGCYPYPDYFTPPPPGLSNGQSQHAPAYLIIVVSLLASFFLLVSYYVIIVKYCSRWNLFRPPPPTESNRLDEEFVDENQGPAIDHPIWYIATVGLQPSIINSITVLKYKKGDALIEGTECSVCLNEFQEDETLRLLPKCNHAFHILCIDTWLRSHTSCPLCRAGIVSDTATTTPAASNDRNSHSLSPHEETQMENSDRDGELGASLVSDGEVSENRTETEDEVELPQADDERKEFEIQPVRRSVSMDLSSAASISFAVSSFCEVESKGSLVNQKEELQESDLGIFQKRESENPSLNRVMGSSSIAQSVHQSPVSLKRSFSYGGRTLCSFNGSVRNR
ncbi:hypothetical protein F0562_035673 [Nyssa sinensis]|uniref:RING-type E3 ubiquitin transferase n=1 Tax=Nyssa sinensis TaxID=561372 RepID=A0A5J5ADR5_9ASTE|nr:hypothetical protein F0562_035673 [Nyssa sinensis]